MAGKLKSYDLLTTSYSGFQMGAPAPSQAAPGSKSLPASGNSLARNACEGAGAPLGAHACENRYISPCAPWFSFS
jgi:hypothetical protein